MTAPMIARITYNLSWLNPVDGSVVPTKPRTIECPYTIVVSGQMRVLAGTGPGVEVDVPFQGITQATTLAVIKNQTGQELIMAWQGNWLPNLPNGGTFIHAFPVPVTAGCITGFRFFLTETQA